MIALLACCVLTAFLWLLFIAQMITEIRRIGGDLEVEAEAEEREQSPTAEIEEEKEDGEVSSGEDSDPKKD